MSRTNARADRLRHRLCLTVSADDLSGYLPNIGWLAADKIAVKLVKLELQLFERLPLNLLVRRALQTASPLTLILPNGVFRHVAEYNGKSKFRIEFCTFSPRREARDGHSLCTAVF